jgi:hypothetical protein
VPPTSSAAKGWTLPDASAYSPTAVQLPGLTHETLWNAAFGVGAGGGPYVVGSGTHAVAYVVTGIEAAAALVRTIPTIAAPRSDVSEASRVRRGRRGLPESGATRREPT